MGIVGITNRAPTTTRYEPINNQEPSHQGSTQQDREQDSQQPNDHTPEMTSRDGLGIVSAEVEEEEEEEADPMEVKCNKMTEAHKMMGTTEAHG